MAVTTEVSFSERFWPSVYELSGSETKQVVKAVTQLGADPRNDSLRLKPVTGDRTGRTWTARASQDLRLLLFKEGAVLVLERAGHHDAMYELAPRLSLVRNEASGRVVVLDWTSAQEPATPVVATEPSDDGPRPFDHWADGDLADAGLGEDEIAAVRRCRSEEDLLDLDTKLDDEAVGLLIDLLGQTPEQWRSPGLDAEQEAEERLRRAITSNGALAGISPLFTAEEITELAAAPIEQWMVFLHPDQRSVVERRYDGPARVRGSAGTGKTVVALHRAAELARRFRDEPEDGPSQVLFTTYIASLPPVFEQLYDRLPGTRPKEVEFLNVDKLANRVCRAAGVRVTLDPKSIEAAFAAACRHLLTSGSPLVQSGITRPYLRDELASVIKGRGVRSVEEYLALERTGRGTRFTEPLRRQVWDLLGAYSTELGARGTIDFADVILLARDHARSAAAPTYRAVVVDEAQDLTLVGLQLLRALVNGPNGVDRPDGLLLVGDGAQRIYPGGFTLRQAGVEVRGRTTVLRRNYRNTAEIIGAAMAVAGQRPVDDLGDTYDRGEADAHAERSGMKPVLVAAASPDDELRFVAERIADLVARSAVEHGDLAVATATNDQAKHVQEALASAGIPTQPLERYDGTPTDRVKVGTHFRIKGLEFKVVFLPYLGANYFPRKPSPGHREEERQEQEDRAVSQLFVAMTRARDGLFLLCSGDPSPVLGSALDAFQIVDT